MLIFLLFYREQPEWKGESDTDEKTNGSQLVVDSNTDMARHSEFNQHGEKYELLKVKDVGIIQLPIIVGVFSAFCNFLAQAGMETFISMYTKWYLNQSSKKYGFL